MSTNASLKPNKSGAARSLKVAGARSRFLDAFAKMGPEEKSRWEQLFDKETLELAARHFQSNPYTDSSPTLEARIEGWAVACHLADKPVRDWWIFGVARNALSLRVFGPMDEEDQEYGGIGIPISIDALLSAEHEKKPPSQMHIDWLLKYHFSGLSVEEIANTEGQRKAEGTIRTTLTELRSLIGLPQRRPSGRPKKSNR